MIRDEELKRLVRYAQGLNVKVSFKEYVPYSNDAGGATIDGSEIVIYVHKKDSKLETILTLIHEIAHILECIHTHNRRPIENLNQALGDEEERKLSRKIIYDFEKASGQWWESIYRETDMKFPINHLYRQRHYDIWQYSYWLRTGSFPTLKVRKKKMKELKKKYASI